MIATVIAAAAVVACAPPAPTDQAVQDLAPNGTLRAAINYGNIVLAQRGQGGPQGVSAELARSLAARLGARLQFVTFEGAGDVVAAGRAGAWDVAFLAIEPARAAEIAFTAPYVLIEGAYLVPKTSPLKSVEAVDAAGVTIGVSQNSAYDLYLTRTLKAATLVRGPTGASIDELRTRGVAVVAGVRQPLELYAASHPDVHVLPGRFQEIRQAMAMPKGRPTGEAYLRAFVEDAKQTGFVARALAASGQTDAKVAPAE